MLTAGAKSYTYDAAGRTVGINAPGGTTTLSYDYESRVTAITGPGINETHTYNGLDTRVGTVQGGVSRTFVRDGSYVTDPVLRDGQATYTPGVSERRGGVSTWSHSGLKNADAQTTSVGAIAATRVYDAFGAELSATGTWKGPFGYAGGFGYQEDSSGLKLLGHRYYDPTTGRFLSRDPIKDGRSWYAYCANDPLNAIDPQGLAETRRERIGSSAVEAWEDFGKRATAIVVGPIVVIPVLVKAGFSWANASEEVRLWREYRDMVEEARKAEFKVEDKEGNITYPQQRGIEDETAQMLWDSGKPEHSVVHRVFADFTEAYIEIWPS